MTGWRSAACAVCNLIFVAWSLFVFCFLVLGISAVCYLPFGICNLLSPAIRNTQYAIHSTACHGVAVRRSGVAKNNAKNCMKLQNIARKMREKAKFSAPKPRYFTENQLHYGGISVSGFVPADE